MSMSPRLLRPRATGFTPKAISGLSLWLDASNQGSLYDATSGGSAVASDGAVARWEDLSGNLQHAIQSTANNRPIRKTAVRNSKDVLRFDGTNDCLQIASIKLPTYVSLFVVSSTTRTGSNTKWFWEHGADVNTNNGFYNQGTSAAWAVRRDGALHFGPSTSDLAAGGDWIGNSWALAATTYDGTGRVYKNNVLLYSSAASGTARNNSDVTADLNIASRNQSALFLTGDIGEMLIYSRVLSDAERTSVSKYLLLKWAL